MQKLILLSTSVLLLVTNSFATEAPICKEIELGASGKKHWSTSWSDGVRSEIVEQLDRNDDLFEKTAPEFKISLGDSFDFNFKVGREVNNNLGLPKSGKITPKDLFSYKVNNSLLMELEAKVNGQFIFSEGSAGTQLVISSNAYPGQELTSCEAYRKVLLDNNNLTDEILENICKNRKKGRATRYYEKVVNYLSDLLGYALKKLSDAEKNLKYAEDPLGGLKVHSSLGLPIDHEVFFEQNNELNVNDIVEHTTFYGVKPLGLQLPLFDGIEPNYYKYRRHFRTVSFQKKIGNKVDVEVSDTILKGNSLEFFKLRPRILSLIKLNFGLGRLSDFDQESLMQRFSIDLNTEQGVDFFKELLSSLYKPSVRLNKESILIDSSEFEDGVIAGYPIYRDGNGEDYRVRLNFFGLLTYETREFFLANHIEYNDQNFSDGQKVVSRKVRSKIGFDLGWFSLNKKDKNLECKADFLSDGHVIKKEDSSLNITCNYKNEYTDNNIKLQVAEFIDTATNGSLKDQDKEKFKNLDYSTKDKINFFTNISFNHDSVIKIVNHTNEEVYADLSRLFFGENAPNVFKQENEKLWRKLRPSNGPKASITEKIIRNSKEYRDCRTALKKVGILDKNSRFIPDPKNGLFGYGAGVDSTNINRCYYFYPLAKRLVGIFNEISTYYKETGRLSKIVKLTDEPETLALTQSLLVRLAGGMASENVRYTYVVLSPNLDRILSYTNGKKYQLGDSGFRETMSSQMQAEYYPRIDRIRYTYNTCAPTQLNAHFKLNYAVENREDVFVDFDLKDFSSFVGENEGEKHISLAETIRDVSGEYHTVIDLGGELDKDSAHNIIFSLHNHKNQRMTKELKVYLGKVNNYLNSEEKED